MIDTELLQALGAEVAELLEAQRVEILRTVDERNAALERRHAEALATMRASHAETLHLLERSQEALEVLRAQVADPVVAFTLDTAGAMHLVQRNGPPRPLPLPDTAAIARALVEALGAALRESLAGELHADVARTFELYCNAPTWTAAAVYGAGDIVQTDVGRTYRVRAGVRAAMGREPGEDAEHWERLGTGGFRVLKSRPAALAAGDVFTEHDARFLHDGQTTILFVPKAPKTSDIERAMKGPHGLAQATQAELRELAARVAALLGDVQRSAQAANDAGELSVQALALMERLREDVDALHRRLDELPGTGSGS